MNNSKRITLSMPSYGRKKGTIRAIDCILKQDIDNWEALVIGDGCPVIQEFLDSRYYKDIQAECKLEALETGSVHLGSVHGPTIQFASLPYPLIEI